MKKYIYYLLYKLRRVPYFNIFCHITRIPYPESFKRTDCAECEGFWMGYEVVMVRWCKGHKERAGVNK